MLKYIPMKALRKPNTTFFAILGILAVIALTIWGAIYATNLLSNNKQAAASHVCVVGSHKIYVAVIKSDQVSPKHTDARLCDKLTITNLDNEQRIIAFGQHEKHTAYDGVEERVLDKGQSLTVELNKTGTYKFHDHEHDEVQGTFTVTD